MVEIEGRTVIRAGEWFLWMREEQGKSKPTPTPLKNRRVWRPRNAPQLRACHPPLGMRHPPKVTVHLHDTIETKGLKKEDVPELRERVREIIAAPVEEALKKSGRGS